MGGCCEAEEKLWTERPASKMPSPIYRVHRDAPVIVKQSANVESEAGADAEAEEVKQELSKTEELKKYLAENQGFVQLQQNGAEET